MRNFFRKLFGKGKVHGLTPEQAEDLALLIRRCKAHGLTREQAEAKGREFLLPWWTDREKAQLLNLEDSATFRKSVKKSK